MRKDELFIIPKVEKELSKDELSESLKKCSQGDLKARDKVIRHNIKLVFNQVNKRFFGTCYDSNELVSIGIIGLIKAVDTYNIDKKFEFSTYAIKCIDNEILMFIRKNKKYINDKSLNQSTYLDKNDIDIELEETIMDEKSFTEEYIQKEINKIVRDIVNQLEDKEKKIIMLRYGFIDDKIYNQKEISAILNISQSYISRVEKKILKKIRALLIDKGILESRKEDLKIEISSLKKSINQKNKSIYEYFKDYSKEEIDDMIIKLSDENIKLLKLRFGEDLKGNCQKESWNSKENGTFYCTLVPKMKKILKEKRTR